MTFSKLSMNSLTELLLHEEGLEALFPCFIQVSENLEILAMGSTVRKVLPTLRTGAPFLDHFTPIRPNIPLATFDLLRNRAGTLVVLDARLCHFQGQFVEGANGLFFLGSPIVHSTEELQRLGLTLSDFPPHDVTGDFLVQLSAAQAMTRDLRLKTDILHEDRTRTQILRRQLERSLEDSQVARAELVSTETQHRAVLEAIHDVVFCVNDENAWTVLNSAWKRLGYEADCVGRDSGEHVHPEDRAAWYRLLASTRQRALVLPPHIRFLSAGGEVRLFAPSAWPTSIGGSVAGVLRDVTVEQDAIERLTERNRLLELAREAANRANRAKSDFLATMSHEIRTPLHSVLGLTELLSELPLSDEQAELVKSVRSSADQLRWLVSDVLDLAKIESGQLELVQDAFDPRLVINDVIAFGHLRVANKPITLEFKLPDEAPRQLIGDAARLRQVMFNLVSNAAKFTERGHILVSGHYEPLTADHGRLRLIVEDSGIGIPASAQGRLFTAFYQGSAATRASGTGLGLHIVKRLVEMMGGSITFASVEGRGTRFEVAVPCHVATELVSEELSEPTPDQVNPVPWQILLVEDTPASQDFATRVLRSQGHAVDVAASGAEAISFASMRRYDLILLDLSLPDMFGIDVAAKIRAHEHSGPPIVALTAHALLQFREQCLQSGFAAYATKPITSAELGTLVSRWADRRATALVVDDSPEARQWTVRCLSHAGMRVLQAETASSALDEFRRGRLDLVVLDLRMPDMNGYELMRWIRERHAGLPIVVLSGADSSTERRQAMEAGASSMLTKPATKEALVGTVMGLLPKTRTASEAMDPPLPRELLDLIPGYLDSQRRFLRDARRALSIDDLRTVQSVGHNLKGTGASYGFPLLTSLGSQLEEMAIARDRSNAESLLDAVEAGLNHAAERLGSEMTTSE